MRENARAELKQRDADISKLEERLARCQIQENEADLSTVHVVGVLIPKV